MKNLFTLSLAALMCVCLNNANAQGSLGANLGIYKSFVENSDAQIGFNLSGKYDINEQIRVGANLGYYFKSYDGLRSFTMPITGLFEYSFNDNDFSPYAGTDFGLYRIGLSGGGESIAEASIGFAPVVGFNYSLSDNLKLNGNLKYHYILTSQASSSAIGFNAGICYKF
jgi:outer membrane protein W